MDLSYLLAGKRLLVKKLQQFGFTSGEGIYQYRQDLTGNLQVRMSLSEASWTLQVFDLTEEEIYVPFELEAADGNFVNGVRHQVDDLVKTIAASCLTGVRQRDRLLVYALAKYQTEPCYPWPEYPEHCTLKVAPDGKWYGLIMKVSFKVLSLKYEGELDVLNVKLAPERIEKLQDGVNYLPAYHMNKKYWLTVRLDGGLALAEIENLLDESYRLVAGKKSVHRK